MRSDMFPASSFGKWETVMIVEEMEGEGVPKSDSALSNEAQVEPLEKRGKFEVSSLRQLSPFSSERTTQLLVSAPGCIRRTDARPRVGGVQCKIGAALLP